MGEVGAFRNENEYKTETCVFEMNTPGHECALTDGISFCLKRRCPIWRMMKSIEKRL